MGTSNDTDALADAVARLLSGATAEGPPGGSAGDVAVEGLARLSGGASRETWAFRAVGPDGARDLILRRDPPGRPGLKGAMAHEADAMRACRRVGLAVPEVLAADPEGATLGTAGLVMSRVEGEALARRILRDDTYAQARPRLAPQLGTFLAGLHAVDPAEVPGLADADPLADYGAAYDQIGDASPTFAATRRWLAADRPDRTATVVVHGDLRLGNVLVGPDGLRAVIDWELVHLGDPVEDLAWMCVKAWRFRSPLPVAGVGTVDDLLGAYEAASGTTVDRAAFRWWLVQKTWQWGVQCMGQAAVHLSGTLRSVELAAIGRRVAEQEWDLVELLAPEAWAVARDATRDDDGRGRAVGHARAAGPRRDDDDVYGRPTAAELVEAVGEFLSGTVMPATSGPVAFHTRVAANVLAVVERQLTLGPAHALAHRRRLDALGVGSTRELCRAIDDGRFDGPDAQRSLWAALAASAGDRLAVANPRHLALP